MKPNWSVEKKSQNVHVIRIPYQENDKWEQRVLLSADRHHDNPHTLQDLEIKHLEQALAIGAPIVDNGDLFCAMQGKYDKRADKSTLRPEHQTDKYLDALVDTASEFYGPYRDLFAVIGYGNHELSILKRSETDLVERLARRLGISTSGYRGWVRFLFQADSGGHRASKTMFHTHGPGGGGGGEVTKGSIRTARRAVYLPDADIVFSGHIHEAWYIEIPRWGLTSSHKIVDRTQYHVQCPTYKQEFEDGAIGWANEREMPPKPLGAWWAVFYYDPKTRSVKVRFERAT